MAGCVWRGSDEARIAMKFRSQLMAALEESVGTDDALAVAEVGNLRLGVCSDETGTSSIGDAHLH